MKDEKLTVNALRLGERIRTARMEQNFSLEYVAEQCNVTAMHIRHVEDGQRLPSLPLFVALCKIFKVSPTYFLADEIELINGVPDAYQRIVEILLDCPPKEAQMIVAMIDTMHGVMKS